MTVPHTRVRGFTFVSVPMALLIVAVLYFGYFHMAANEGAKSVGIQSLQTSKAIACRTQRQQIERDVQMYAATHDDVPPRSLDDLAQSGIRVPSCPEGGRYQLSGSHVICSLHQ